jgi:hypothetical protein
VPVRPPFYDFLPASSGAKALKMVSASEVRSVINQATALRKRGVTPLQVSTTDYSNKDFKRLPITSAISRLELDLFNSEGDKVVTEADNRTLVTENSGLRSENSALLKEIKDLKAQLETSHPGSTSTKPPEADRGSPDGVEEEEGDSGDEDEEEEGLGRLVAGNPDPTSTATPPISPKAKKAAKKAGQRERKATSKRKEGDPPVCSAVYKDTHCLKPDCTATHPTICTSPLCSTSPTGPDPKCDNWHMSKRDRRNKKMSNKTTPATAPTPPTKSNKSSQNSASDPKKALKKKKKTARPDSNKSDGNGKKPDLKRGRSGGKDNGKPNQGNDQRSRNKADSTQLTPAEVSKMRALLKPSRQSSSQSGEPLSRAERERKKDRQIDQLLDELEEARRRRRYH